MTDPYKRRLVDSDHHQCGCYWERNEEFGDVLIECEFHAQATEARSSKTQKQQRKEHLEKIFADMWNKKIRMLPIFDEDPYTGRRRDWYD